MFEGISQSKSGIRVTTVSKNEINIVSNANDRINHQTQNVIQICFEQHSIIWDLDKNAEIRTIYKIQDFQNMEQFVRTGFKFYNLINETDNMKNCQFWLWNQSCTIISIPKNFQQMSQLFRSYTALDIYEMLTFEQQLEADVLKISSDQVNLDIFVANIYSETYFSQFVEYPEMFDVALGNILKMAENKVYIRKLFYTICMPFKSVQAHTTFNKKLNKQGVRKQQRKTWLQSLFQNGDKEKIHQVKPFMSILYQSHLKESKQDLRIQCDIEENYHTLTQWLVKENKPIIDTTLRILLQCDELCLHTLIQQFGDFEKLFSVQSEMVNEYMGRAFIQTPMTQRVTNLRWSQDYKMVVFSAKTAQFSEDKIKQQYANTIENKRNWLQTLQNYFENGKYDRFCPVKVRVIEVFWLNKNIKLFYKFLQSQPQTHFENELIKVLLQQQDYKLEIMLKVFFPYLLYMICCQYQFMVCTSAFTQEFQSRSIFLKILIVLLTLYLCYLELQQIIFKNFAYLAVRFNYMYLGSLFINLVIVFNSNTIDQQKLVELTSVACLLMWILLYKKLRLFTVLAFYVKLIIQTIKDIFYFLIFVVIIIAAFATSFLIIDSYYTTLQGKTYTPLLAKITESPFLDAMAYSYLLTLGNFTFDQFYDQKSRDIIWFYFILSTFISNIVFFNMLIAIMGDTFGKVTENKEINSLIQQTKAYADYIQIVKVNQNLNENRFLYIITPDVQEDDSQEWQGGFNLLSNLMKQFKKDLFNQAQKTALVERQAFQEFKQIIDKLKEQQKQHTNRMNLIVQQKISSTEINKQSQRTPRDHTADVKQLLNQVQSQFSAQLDARLEQIKQGLQKDQLQLDVKDLK